MEVDYKKLYDNLLDEKATKRVIKEELSYLSNNLTENQLLDYIRYTSSVIKVTKDISSESQDSKYFKAMTIMELKEERIRRILNAVNSLEPDVSEMIFDKHIRKFNELKMNKKYEQSERTRRNILSNAYIKIASYLNMEVTKQDEKSVKN